MVILLALHKSNTVEVILTYLWYCTILVLASGFSSLHENAAISVVASIFIRLSTFKNLVFDGKIIIFAHSKIFPRGALER